LLGGLVVAQTLAVQVGLAVIVQVLERLAVVRQQKTLWLLLLELPTQSQ
jgi:hypothetical protein